MAIKINFDSARSPETPTLLLANRNGEKLGQIPAQNIVLKDSLNNAAEISFSVYKYRDAAKDAIWDKIVNSRLVWCKEWNVWFELTADIDESDKTVKNVSCTQLAQAELSQVHLYNIEINTENDIAREAYEKTVLYDSDNPGASLLHRIMEKTPHYSVVHVDSTIRDIQRTFTFDGISVYDAFQQIAEEIGCLFRFHSGTNPDGTIQRAISVYDLQSNCLNLKAESHKKRIYRGEFTGKCPKCGSTDISEGFGQDTTIFITSDELADEIQFTTDSSSVKNCFKLEAGDDLMTATIRNCNPNGSDYIWHISEDTKKIMSEELTERLAEYDKTYAYYQNEYAVDLDKELHVISSIPFIFANPVISEKIFHQAVNESVYGPMYRPIYEPIKPLRKYVGKYNPIAKKYAMESLCLPESAEGYPALMTAYYNTIDLELYLQSSMMPEIKIEDTDAKKELDKLINHFKGEDAFVGVSDTSKISAETAKSAIITLAKTIIDSRYQIEAKEGYKLLSGQKWKGGFTITGYSDKTDSAATKENEDIEIQLTDNQEIFIKQSIEKMLIKNYKDDMSISGLFQMDASEVPGNVSKFQEELDKYCLNRLTSFHDGCKACIEILEKEGIADKEIWEGTEGKNNLYETLYLSYKNKLEFIELEINERSLDIDIVKAMQECIKTEKDNIHKELDFEEFIKSDNGEPLWIEFCSFRREDKYSNSNYISDGLTSTELFERAMEFIEAASNELYKSSELQHSISASLKNLLVMEKFEPLIGHFEAGNWVRVQVDGKIYKLRMTEYEINYEELDKISVGFSDLLTVSDGVSDMESVIQNAASMSKSYSSVQRQASQGSKGNSVLQNWVEDGLDASKVKLMNEANNQTQTWDEHGMLFRQYNYADDTYSPTQMKITDSSILFTDDNWNTVKTAIGNIYYRNPEYNPKAPANAPASKEFIRSYGINGETIVGKLLLGEQLGIHNEDGSLTFDTAGLTVKNDINAFKVTPNNDILLSLTTKNDKGEEEPIFCVDSDGKLYIKGDGSALDLSKNSSLSDKINEGVSDKISRGEELCFYNSEFNNPNEKQLSAKINQNGNLFYYNGSLVGRIGISGLEQDASKQGLLFELDTEGSHISFTQKEKQGDDYVSKNMFCISKGNNTYQNGIHFGCNAYGHGFTMDNVNLTNVSFNGQSGVTKKISVVTDVTEDSDGNITPIYAEITITNGIITDVS